ncbi:LysM peptidoglycan-binding domain-containing protein [Actomonas aquatica]|uniref:LysM peptidoglycan-binding domain-containing protein n=1 Tax=Actomonas aquatica TaxID=2866162 RepID=A0ABZ1CC04_9BACT|nr:LysM peptidoglycan-binding domain-containing protein [Opitutus sp. WL0086]WRQ89104.1 LysM peptidoglycan-binding domain-containing protein [Opitutus sp. WL0086]
MKLLNILGAVIAAHVAVLVLAVAIPGCRSTRTATPAADTPTTAYNPPAQQTAAPTFTSAPELSDRDLNPPLAGSAEPPIFDPNAPAVSVGGSGRYSPTRPNSTVATAIQTETATPVSVAPAQTYTVQRGDNLWTLAKRNNITVRELAAANSIPADSMLRLGQVLVIPGQQPAPTPVTTAASADETSSKSYTIQSGDTLGRIARRHGVTVAELKAFNNLRSDLVRVGDTLSIPESTTAANSPAVSANTTATAPASTATVPAGTYKHVVKPGESLTVIARRYGVKVGDVIVANMIRDPSLIRAGQELVIPGWDATSTPPAGTVPATRPATNTVTTSPATTYSADDDLDAGLDDSLDNVPVIDVERAPVEEDEPPIQTITIGGGSNEGPSTF